MAISPAAPIGSCAVGRLEVALLNAAMKIIRSGAHVEDHA
jgi:hypothetical protein